MMVDKAGVAPPEFRTKKQKKKKQIKRNELKVRLG